VTSRAVPEALIWWSALYAIHLGIISTVSPTELVVGGAAAALGSVAAVATRRILLSDLTLAPPPLRGLLLLPPQIVRDCALLLWPARGRFAEVPVPSSRGGGVTTLMLSIAPGTYVAGVSQDGEVLVLHRAEDRPSCLEREVTSC
jgi:hypothetical protein